MPKRRGESFAATVARITAQPPRPAEVPVGRHGDVWGDPTHEPFRLVNADLSSEGARDLAARGARVVYDACGCGGADCELDWLSETAVRDLVRAGTRPVKHASKDGLANLEHWRSDSDRDLVVVVSEVSWGDRI